MLAFYDLGQIFSFVVSQPVFDTVFSQAAKSLEAVFKVREKASESHHTASLGLGQFQTHSSFTFHVGKALAHELLDGRLDSLAGLGAGLKIRHRNRSSKLLSLFFRDFSLGTHIAFVADEYLWTVTI